VNLEGALLRVHDFLREQGILESEFVFMSCGDYDGNKMKSESKKKNFTAKVPNYMKRWINIKKTFPIHLYRPLNTMHAKSDEEAALITESYDWTSTKTIRDASTLTKGMLHMLEIANIPLQGSHHLGIDDSRNIAACVISALEKGFTFCQSMIHASLY